MLILVTNDDGIHAPGLAALAEELGRLGQVAVVAPDRERSATGHSLTLHSPLRAEEIRPQWFAIDGTPTDCVNLGIHGLFRERPALVVSGINRGSNMGDDITYSGTVAAAMEATLMGVPAFAVSLAVVSEQQADYRPAARFSAHLAQALLERGLPRDTFFNVNVPCLKDEQLRGARLTRQGKRIYGDLVIENTDPRGRKYYWIGAGDLDFKDIEGTDFHAVHRGFVSLTPLHLDLTNYSSFDALSTWDLFANET
ncbi:5'/3'-nucleotidase SurE [Geoalkalibacter sp.]|uniref:5'/3'-nucleotidase SurE n=1 Tax=Geoalkalibacter sp. TaxID=3041440 RepID=UPI00272ED664|nr:5'/3'-nucleotidase SurE [Geoalkalibacter sp.]